MPKSDAKTCLVIVTYNRKEMLVECLKKAIPEAKKCDATIFVIDNASTDGTKKSIQQYLKDIKYFNTGKNLGGAGGFTFGVNKAVQGGFKYAWLMDDDAMIEKCSLKNIIEDAESLKGDFSYLSSVVKWTDNKLCEMNRPTLTEKHNGNKKLYDGMLKTSKKKLIPINATSFVGFFLNLELAKTHGLPIPEMFIYGDDYEYSARLAKIRPAYVSTRSVIVHKMKQNIMAYIHDDSLDRLDRYYYNYRNLNYIFRKHFGARTVLLYWLKFPYYSLKIFLKAKDHRFKRFGILAKGYFSGIFFNPKIKYPKAQ